MFGCEFDAAIEFRLGPPYAECVLDRAVWAARIIYGPEAETRLNEDRGGIYTGWFNTYFPGSGAPNDGAAGGTGNTDSQDKKTKGGETK